jgi:hypothetical protein
LAVATLVVAEADASANTGLRFTCSFGRSSGRPIFFGRTAGSKATPS